MCTTDALSLQLELETKQRRWASTYVPLLPTLDSGPPSGDAVDNDNGDVSKGASISSDGDASALYDTEDMD